MQTPLRSKIAPFSIINWGIFRLTNIGDLPSDVQILAVAQTSGSTMLYVSTQGNDVHRSRDHSASQITLTADLTLPMYIRSGLAVNPITPTLLFTGEHYGGLPGVGVYRSADGGNSWTVSLPDQHRARGRYGNRTGGLLGSTLYATLKFDPRRSRCEVPPWDELARWWG